MAHTINSFRASKNKGWFYNFVAQGLWGSGSAVISLIDRTLPSTMLVSIRHGLGAVLLLLDVIIRRKTAIFKTLPWKHVIILGLLAGALPDVLLITAVRHSNPIIAILLARLEIPLGVLFAHKFLKEPVTTKVYIASLIGFVGTVFIAYKPGQSLDLHNDFYLGVLAGIGAGVTWGLAAVYAKYILNQHADSQALTIMRLGLGSFTSLILTLLLVSQPLFILQNLHATDWLWIVYLGILNSGIGYLFFYRSMQSISAYVAQILMGFSMLVSVALGIVLGVPISLLQWVGIITIITSIYMVKAQKTQTDES